MRTYINLTESINHIAELENGIIAIRGRNCDSNRQTFKYLDHVCCLSRPLQLPSTTNFQPCTFAHVPESIYGVRAAKKFRPVRPQIRNTRTRLCLSWPKIRYSWTRIRLFWRPKIRYFPDKHKGELQGASRVPPWHPHHIRAVPSKSAKLNEQLGPETSKPACQGGVGGDGGPYFRYERCFNFWRWFSMREVVKTFQ